MRWAILAAFVAVELEALRRHRRGWLRTLRPTLYHAVWATFLFVALASATWSLTPRSTVTHAVSVALLGLAAFTAVWRYARTEGNRAVVAKALLVGMGIVLGLSLVSGLLDPAAGRQTDVGSHITRWRGIFESPNELGLQGLLVLPLALTGAFTLQGSKRRLSAAVAVLAVVLMLASGTRSSVAIAVVGVAALVALTGRVRRAAMFALASIAVLVTAGAIVYATGHARQTLRPYTASTLGGRTEAWSQAGRRIARRPVDGWGFATEAEIIRRLRLIPVSPPPGCVGDCPPQIGNGPFRQFAGGHFENSYVGAVVQLGAIGGLLLGLQVGFPLLARLRSAFGGPWTWALQAVFIEGAAVAVLESYLWSAGNLATLTVWGAAAVVGRAYLEARSAST